MRKSIFALTCAFAQQKSICAAIGEENSFFSDVTDVPSCANAQKKHVVGNQPEASSEGVSATRGSARRGWWPFIA